MNKLLKKVNQYIKKYDTIVIARHVNSDLDCLGSQFGLKEWIKLNYPSKKVYCLGEDHSSYSKSFMPKCDNINQISEDFLGICVDVNQTERIDNKELFLKAKEKICIDHHHCQSLSQFDFAYVDEHKMSCSEIIGEMLLSSRLKKINKDMAKFLYAGIASDSGDFYYENCDYQTFSVASKLIKRGNFNPFNDVNIIARQRSFEDLKIVAQITSKIVLEDGFAYYQVSLEEQKEMGVTTHSITEKINEFNRIEDFQIILSLGEESPNNYRASIRSKKISVVEVAHKFGGGGHKNACGVKNLTIQNVEELKKELKGLIKGK